MRLGDEALDDAILAADPLDGTEFGSVAPDDRARGAQSRIVSSRSGGRSAMPRAGRLLVAVGAVLTIGAILGALIIAGPSDPAAPSSGAPGGPATSPNTLPSTPLPRGAPGEPAVDPGPAAPGRSAAVATPPAGAHTGSGIALLEQRGLAQTEIPVELLRGDYCQIYADRVHRIAEIPSGGAVYLAWGRMIRSRGSPSEPETMTGADAVPPPRSAIARSPSSLRRWARRSRRRGRTPRRSDRIPHGTSSGSHGTDTRAWPQKTLHLTVQGPAGVHRVTMSYAAP